MQLKIVNRMKKHIDAFVIDVNLKKCLFMVLNVTQVMRVIYFSQKYCFISICINLNVLNAG